MSSMESLEDLLQDELKDIYDAETQLTKALPKLAKKASTWGKPSGMSSGSSRSSSSSGCRRAGNVARA